MKRLVFLMLFSVAVWGQPASNTAARNPKYVNANVSAGTTVPASCTYQQIFIKTNAASGSNTYACVNGAFVAQAGGGAGTGDVTAASNIGKGQVAVGNDGAKAVEPSTLDATVTKMTKGVPSAATAGTDYLAPVATNPQTGATYAILTGDRGKLVTIAYATAQATSIAQAGSTGFPDGWEVTVLNSGAGTATITPATSTIEGAATLVLTTGQAAKIWSNGTNYRASRQGKVAAATLADTATALAANGANCSAGSAPLGVDASGTSEGCFAVQTALTGPMSQAVANSADNTLSKSVGTSGTAFEKTGVTVDDSNVVTAAGFKTAAGTAAGLMGLTQGTACTPGTTEICVYAPAAVTSYGLVLPGVVGSSGVLHWGVSSTVATLSSSAVVGADFGTKTANYVFAGATSGGAANPDFRALVAADIPSDIARLADPVFTGSVQLPNGGPTIDAAGEIGIDTTTDQLQFYGAAKRALPTIHSASFVIMAPVATDDFPIMKAPYGMTILSIHGVMIGSTNVIGQLQECDSAGANCADLDSDITFNGGDDADDGTLTDSTIAKDNWIAWKTTSISATPTSLTVTFTYRVVAD